MAERRSEQWQRYLASLPPELAALPREPPADVLVTAES